MSAKENPAAGAAARGAKKARSSNSSKKKDSSASSDIQFLDAHRPVIAQPLSLIDCRAYAVGALPAVRDGEHQDLGVIIRGDGALFTADPVEHPIITGSISEIGVDFRSGEYPTHAISAAGIRRFQAGHRPEPSTVLTGVFGVIDHFVDFNRSLSDQRTMCELVACYVISTYFTPAFDVVGYLWITGAPGSGKTQLLATVSELAFLGRTVLGASSYAATRDAASWGATIAFDDSEIIEDIGKRELILAGSRRGAKVTIKRKIKDEWENVEIDTFCPRLFSAIQRPDYTLGSRCIAIPTVRSADANRTRSEPRDHSSWPTNRQSLIDDLWMLALANLPTMRRWYDEAAEKASIIGRDLDPWRGILSVALWVATQSGFEGLFDRMNHLALQYQHERAKLESGTDCTRLIIEWLLARIGKESQSVLTFDANELAKAVNAMAAERAITDEDGAFTNAKKVGWVLRSLRMSKAPKGKNNRPWRISKDEAKAFARAYGVRHKPEENAENAENAETPPHGT